MYKQKAKMKQNKPLKRSRGITLIALVITIIVLLILAAVSIATLTGENGILSQADKAGTETKVKGEEEQIGLSYNAVMTANKGTGVTEGQLEDELQKYDSGAKVTTKGENFEVEFSNGNVYKVKKDGTIQNGSVTTAEEVNKHIGQVVKYEESKDLNPTIKQQIDGWRIFYASEEEMFLISSGTISSEDAFGGSSGIPLISKTKTAYTGAKDVFATDYGATYNGMWKATNSIDTSDRSKATAYLCDSNNWEEYVGENAPEGTYAVGGPTKELLVLSWNEAVKNGGDDAPKTEAKWANGDVVDVGYLYNKPFELSSSVNPYPIQSAILSGLYNNQNLYWLASPSKPLDLCAVSGDGFVGCGTYSDNGFGVRPIVSIPMPKVQIGKNGEVSIVEN